MPKKKTKKDRDFQKVKFKVGKKLPKAENITSTAFKSKSIIVKEQLKDTSVNNRNQDVTKKVRNPQVGLPFFEVFNSLSIQIIQSSQVLQKYTTNCRIACSSLLNIKFICKCILVH